MGLSTVDSRVRRIDAERGRLKISHAKFCRAAGIEQSDWYRLRRGEHVPRDSTLIRLDAALAGARTRLGNSELIARLFRATAALLRLSIGADAALIAACTKRSKHRTAAHEAVSPRRFQRMVMYLVAVELEVDNAALARALSTTRQNVMQARSEIHDLRDHPLVDALFERCAVLLKGTPA